MRRTVLIVLCVVFALVSFGFSQQQLVTITASKIADPAGNLLANGKYSWQPTDCHSNPYQYHVGGGGWAISRPVVGVIVNGASTQQVNGQTMKVADTSQTGPQNICYDVTITDSTTQRSYPVIKNVQPAASNYWCNAGVCNFDDFVPTTPALAVQYAGGVNAGVASINGIAGAYNFQGAVTCTGTTCNFTGVGTGMANPMTTANDIIVGGTGGTPTRKAAGSNGTYLGMHSGVLGYYQLQASDLPVSGVTPNSYSCPTFTVDVYGRLIAASSGTCSGSVTPAGIGGDIQTNNGAGGFAAISQGVFAKVSNNLSDLLNPATARANLGLNAASAAAASGAKCYPYQGTSGSGCDSPSGAGLQAANNLSDVANVATARSNLGLNSAASATPSGTKCYPYTGSAGAGCDTPTGTGGGLATVGVCDDTTDDTTVIQAALTAGGTVTLPANKTCKVTACLSIPSGTKLLLNGAKLHFTDYSGCIIQNANAQAAAIKNVTVNVTSGSSTVTATSGTFASTDVGKTIAIPTPVNAQKFATRITGYTDSTHVTTYDPINASGTGLVSGIYAIDSNITVEGPGIIRRDGPGLTSNPTNGMASGYSFYYGREESLGTNSVLFRHADNVTIRNWTMDFQRGNFCVGPMDDFNFVAENIDVKFCNSTPIQFDGPSFNGVVRNLRGYHIDDSTAITGMDWPCCNDMYGNVANITWDHIRGSNIVTTPNGYQGNLMRLQSGAGSKVRDVTYHDIGVLQGGFIHLSCFNADDDPYQGVSNISGITIDGLFGACDGYDADGAGTYKGDFQLNTTNSGTLTLMNVGTGRTFSYGKPWPNIIQGAPGTLQAKKYAGYGTSATAFNITPLTVATLPSSPSLNDYYQVMDGTSASDCSTGGSTNIHWCYWTGSAWASAAVSGGSMVYPSGTGFAVVSGGSSWGSTIPKGTMTDGDTCRYTTASGLSCDVTPSGGGSVTSVTFTGDGTVLSSTPSSAVTTTGTVTASLNTQSANKVLAGPTSGAAAAPTFRSLVAADIPLVPTTISSGAITVSGNYGQVVCTTTCTVMLPAPAAGSQYCVRNVPGTATAITLAALAGVYYELTNHTGWGTVNHTVVSGGAATDNICLYGYDATHYLVTNSTGTWTD